MAKELEIYIDQGADWSLELSLVDSSNNPKNLTGISAEGKLKRNYLSDSDDTLSFSATISDPASDGIITLALTNVQTNSMKEGRYLYDVEITEAAKVTRILEGQAVVKPSVTK